MHAGDPSETAPSLLICEYNCHVPASISASLPFNPTHQHKKDKIYGASLLALSQLARTHGYRLIHLHGPLNLYFIRKELKAWDDIEAGLGLSCLADNDLGDLSNTETFMTAFTRVKDQAGMKVTLQT